MRAVEKKKFWCIFIALYLIEVLSLYFIFAKPGGMLLSCFTIDLIMAVAYCVFSLKGRFRKNWLSICLCSTKFLGDFFAWVYYREYSKAVLYIGIVVSALNIFCIGALFLENEEKDALPE